MPMLWNKLVPGTCILLYLVSCQTVKLIFLSSDEKHFENSNNRQGLFEGKKKREKVLISVKYVVKMTDCCLQKTLVLTKYFGVVFVAGYVSGSQFEL